MAPRRGADVVASPVVRSVVARRAAIALLAAGAACVALLLAAGAENGAGGARGVGRRLQGWGNQEPVHVCFTSDDTDLRAVAVAMQSAYSHASNAGRLRFHLVVPSPLLSVCNEVLKTLLPHLAVDVRSSPAVQKNIAGITSMRATSRARRDLSSPFNFAAFYLHDFLSDGEDRVSPDRIIYIDPDTIVLGDLIQLHDMDMKGQAVAAVKDCNSQWEDYIDMLAVEHYGVADADPTSCVLQRTIFMYDVQKWVQMGITAQIEEWMRRFAASPEELWFEGAATAPWMLTIGRSFVDLGKEWGCQGLARYSMTIPQSKQLRRNGWDFKAFKTLGANFSDVGRVQPFIATCSSTAKLLHFDGAMRPWLVDRFSKMPPACALPVALAGKPWKWSRTVKVFCEETVYVSCPEVWWQYITEEVACALKDFNKEWGDEEKLWTDYQVDLEEAQFRAIVAEKRQEAADFRDTQTRAAERAREARRERFRRRWGVVETPKRRAAAELPSA